MKKIDYLPKFQEREDIKARQKELVELRKELIATGKLNASEIEEINDFDIMLCADGYSRNYIIRRINELVDFVRCR
jgi:cytidylate kinase